MDFIQDLTARYIEFKQTEDECSSETIIRYEFLIGVYGEFLGTRCNDYTGLILYLNTANREDVFEALLYYITSNMISSEDTCDLFISVVRGFYRFLLNIKVITNNDLISSFDHNMPDNMIFTTKYAAFKKKLKQDKLIRFSSEAAPLEESKAKELKTRCKEDFALNINPKNTRRFHTLMTTVIVRLVMYAGLSQKTISDLAIRDYHPESKILQVNDIEIRLNEELAEDLTEYISIRKSFVKESTRLFIRTNGASIKNMMGSYLGYILKRKDKAGSVIAVSKYAIIRMLQNDIGVGFVGDLTGYESGVIMPCIEMSEIVRENDYIDILFRLAH